MPDSETPEALADLRAQWLAIATEPLSGLPAEALAASARQLAHELLQRTPADPALPEHLRGDGPRQRCERCGRYTFRRAEFDTTDAVPPRPSGRPCGGRFVSPEQQ